MRSLIHRKDDRNLNTFSDNIKDFTEREYFWGLALRLDFCERGMECEIIEHGVDNNGNLIKDHLLNYNVDKIFKFKDKQIHIEIKTIPEYVKNFFTFKVSSLKSCLLENAMILVPRKNNYYLIKAKTIEYLIQKYPHKIYEKFSPNDLAIRIFMNDIKKLILEEKITEKIWKNKAKNFIENNKNILFREKTQNDF